VSTVLFLCALLAVLVLVLVLTWLLRRSAPSAEKAPFRPPLPPLIIDDTPDLPEPFGYKMSWLAIRSEEPQTALEALGLRDVMPANWRSGVEVAYRFPGDQIFVSPAVSGWVLCVGHSLPSLDPPAGFAAWKSFMEGLSARFVDVQYFANHRVSSYAAWGRYQNGRFLRAYAAAEDPLINEGERTVEEIELGFDFATPENLDADFPEEEVVMALAGAWGVDPTQLHELGLTPGVGWVGRLQAP
jgi:hypothetical protein